MLSIADGSVGLIVSNGTPEPPGKTTNIFPVSGLAYGIGLINDLGDNAHANDSAGITNPGGKVGILDNESKTTLTASNAS